MVPPGAQYGNIACTTNGQTSGPCTNYSFSTSNNNHITTTGFAYDAAGDVTAVGVHTYQWDAEGRMKQIVDSGISIAFDAFGRRVYRSTSSAYVSYLLDPEGQLLGGTWTGSGWNAEIPFNGRLLAEYSGDTRSPVYFDHPNALGSEQQWTGPTGTETNAGELQFYPWGQEGPSTTNGVLFQLYASLQWADPESDGYQTPNRYFIPRHGRWLTPDPIGKGAARLEDPQTWNMYVYARNNPTTLTDPSGLDFHLTCKQTKDNASTCQGGHIGTTDDKGKFTATVVTSASLKDPKSGVTGTVTEGGVKITTASGTYTGQFINGTPAATLQGSDVFAPFTFNITGQSSGSLLRGSWQFNRSAEQATNWMSSHGAWTCPVDILNPFHPNTQQYGFSNPNNPAGPSMHLSQPLGVRTGIGAYGIDLQTYPSAPEGPFRVDAHGTVWGHVEDVWDVLTQ